MHCKRVRPLLEQFQAETGKQITELEVWHSEENARVMRSYGETLKKACMGELGVPSFYNEKNGKAICGQNITLEMLKEWASG